MDQEKKKTAEGFEDFRQTDFPGGKDYLVRKRGKMHVAFGTVCQDYCLSEYAADGLFISAVADGHGSEEYVYSDIGSKLACEVTAGCLKEIYQKCLDKHKDGGEMQFCRAVCTKQFRQMIITEWEKAVLADYELRADHTESAEQPNRQQKIRKYGTTLLFAAITNNCIAVGQLGDGGILLFNRSGSSQPFRRSYQKKGSGTFSLASGRALYAFQTAVFPRSKFDGVFLSTDGIWDRLVGSAKYSYVMELTSGADRGAFPDEPFLYHEDIEYDLHVISKDDCTISLVLLDQPSESDVCDILKQHGYLAKRWSRILPDADIYLASKANLPFLIHVFPSGKQISAPEIQDPNVTVMPALESFTDETNRCYKVYPYYSALQELSQRIENNMQLEQNYRYKEPEKPFENSAWLHILEKLTDIQETLLQKGMRLSALQLQTCCADESGKLLLFDDGFAEKDSVRDRDAWINFRGQFSILGKLVSDQLEIPLFETSNPNEEPLGQQEKTSQVIYIPDPDREGIFLALCRMQVSDEGEQLLQNSGTNSWAIPAEDGKEKKLIPGKFLRLSPDRTFSLCTAQQRIPFRFIRLRDISD